MCVGGHQSCWIKAHPNDLILIWLILQRSYFQLESHLWYWGLRHNSTHNTRAFFPHCFCFSVGTSFWLIWSFFQVHALVLQCLVTADLLQCTFCFRSCIFHDLKFHLVYSCSPPYTYTHTHKYTMYVNVLKHTKIVKVHRYFCFIMFVFSFKSLSIFNIKSILKSLCINFIIFIIYWSVYCFFYSFCV